MSEIFQVDDNSNERVPRFTLTMKDLHDPTDTVRVTLWRGSAKRTAGISTVCRLRQVELSGITGCLISHNFYRNGSGSDTLRRSVGRDWETVCRRARGCGEEFFQHYDQSWPVARN